MRVDQASRASGDCCGSEAQDAALVDDEDVLVASAESCGDARGTCEHGRRDTGSRQIGCCLCAVAVVSVECEDLYAGFVFVALVNIFFKGGTRPYASPSVVAYKKEDGDGVGRMADAIRSAIGGLKLKFTYFFTHSGLGKSCCA